MPDMTEDEMKFFETGELSPALEAEHQNSVLTPPNVEETVVVEEPVIEEKVAEVVPPPVVVPPVSNADVLALTHQIEELKARLEAPAPKVPDPEIDPNVDPLGHMMQQMNKINATVGELQTNTTKAQEEAQQRAQFEQFTNTVKTAQADFEKATPDFKEAYNHIRALRTEDLRLAGATEAQIPQILLQDELQLAQTALQRGQNPAEQMYGMAKRYGYAPKAAAAAAPPTAAAKIDALKAGQAAARTIAPAAPAAAAPSLATLREASSNDLNRLVQDDNLWAKVVGGRSGNDIF